MSHINRIASPMSLCEEDLFDVDKKVESKIKFLEQLQKESPAFLVGTIDKINHRISNLDEELSKYESQLVIESRTPEPVRRVGSVADSYSAALSLRQTTPSEKKYDVTQRRQKKNVESVAKSSDAPRLVELQQFPGWNKKRCASLPHSLETTKVLDHTVAAQSDLKQKIDYRHEFRRLLYSKLQSSILEDSFWWFFLEKFHPDSVNQGKLFKRIASNFIGLLLNADIPKFRDLFFSNYGSTLAQSVYSAFCLAFPQSWRQFDEPSFKELLAQVCNQWVSGIPPPPRTYEKWNHAALEPEGMRKETIKKKKRHEHGTRAFGGRASTYSSAGSTKTSSIRSPTGSHKPQGFRLHTAKSDSTSITHSPKLTPRVAELMSEQNALSTITEEPMTNTTESTVGAKLKATSQTETSSCAAGRRMEFSRNVFNVYGRSPLLAQFSRQFGFERKSSFDVLVHHPLIQTPPPKDAETYQDIIRESRKRASKAAQKFKQIHEKNSNAHKSFCAKQRDEMRTFRTKTDKLLSRPRQVHYLSNLILMEMKNMEEDTNPVGGSNTVQAALAAESTD